MWEQYSACLKPLLEGDVELQGVKAKLLQRGLYVGKQLVIVYGLARRIPPPSLWQELHAYYRLAEMLDCAVTAVSDDLQPHAVGVSCYSTYCHALLLGLADPCALSVRQIELTDRWLGQWARKIFPYAQQRETEGPVILMDLDSSVPGVARGRGPANPPPSMRFGYPGKLATSVRGRMKRLAAGATPAELQLGHDTSTEGSVALLAHLDARWYQLPRRDRRCAHESIQLTAGGVQAAYFRVGGRTFDRQDPLGRLTFQGAQHLQTLGALTDYDRYKEEAERNWPWERWQGEHTWRARQAAAPRRDALSLVPRPARRGARRRAHASGLRHSRRGRRGPTSLRCRLPSGPASRARWRCGRCRSHSPRSCRCPALLLSATDDVAASLVVPPRTFNAGRVLRSMDTGPERKFRLTKLAQRGGDFERVAFEES